MNNQHSSLFSSAQLAQAFTERMESIREGKTFPGSIPSGFQRLDEFTGGFQRGLLYIIGSRPGVGKTTFMLNLVHQMIMAPVHPGKVAIFTPHLSASLLMQRLISCNSGVALEKIYRGRVEEAEWQPLKELVSQLAGAPLVVDESPVLTIRSLEEKCESLAREGWLDIIFIDYLQLMTPEKGRYRDEEIAGIMRGLKELAQKINIPVVVLSQLSRNVEMRKEGQRIPQLSDLRDSGAIEQAADGVLFLYRPEYYDLGADNAADESYGETLVRIAKNRMGPLETIRFKALLHIQRFFEFPLGFTEVERTAGKWTRYFDEKRNASIHPAEDKNENSTF